VVSAGLACLVSQGRFFGAYVRIKHRWDLYVMADVDSVAVVTALGLGFRRIKAGFLGFLDLSNLMVVNDYLNDTVV
jgi:hypothetical protein